jgi:hypothetical protein
MQVLKFLKEYWTQIMFFISMLLIVKSYIEATKCSLRNDILTIWDKCKSTKTITSFQLESYTDSRDLYFKLGGDGFIHALDEKIMKFKVID